MYNFVASTFCDKTYYLYYPCYPYFKYLFALVFLFFHYQMYLVFQGICLEVSSLHILFLFNLSNIKESCKLTSLCQDFSYTATKFRCWGKHCTIYNWIITRNVELIKTTYRLEHEVSYSQFFEINSAFTIKS